MVYVGMTDNHRVRCPFEKGEVRDGLPSVLLGVGAAVQQKVKAVAVKEVGVGANLAPAPKRS